MAPYILFKEQGYEVTLVSMKGGKVRVDIDLSKMCCSRMHAPLLAGLAGPCSRPLSAAPAKLLTSVCRAGFVPCNAPRARDAGCAGAAVRLWS